MAVNGLNYTSGNKLFFTTSGSTRGVVDNEGRWGLGTLSPTNIVHISGATDPLTITGLQSGTTDGSILTIDGSGVVGTRGDIFVSASITDNVITFTDSDGSSSSLAAIDAITGLTISSNVISYEGTGSFGSDITVDALTSASYSDWGINASGTGTVSGNFELPFITGGSYNAGSDELTLVINGGVESNIVISGFEGSDTFVTSGAINSPANGTLRLTRNDAVDVDITGFTLSTGGDSGSGTLYMGDTLTLNGADGITTTDNGDGSFSIDLDDTAVTPGSYGDASTVSTFTVDQQGRLTDAGETSIAISSTAVTNFDSAVLSSVFETANFVDSTEIDFTVNAGVSVTAGVKSSSITNDMLAGSIANDKLVNDSVTLGSTEITLGAAATTEIAGLTSVTATTFTGALVGNASSATVLQNARDFSISGDITANAVSFNGSGDVVLSASIDNGVVTNDMLAGSISNDKLVNSGFDTAGTGGSTGSISLGDTISFVSTDGSVTIADNGSGTFDIEVVDGTDTTITGGTYDESAGTLELRNNDGGTINISGTWDYFSGVTEADNQLTFKSNDNTDSSVTIKAMTGGTFDLASGVITAEGSDSPANISLGTDFVTGVTEANNVISVVKNGGSAVDSTIQAFTGASIAANVITLAGSGLSDDSVTVDAITSLGYNGSWGVSGDTTGTATASVALPFITSGSYDAANDILTLDVNDASGVSDITISGFEGSDTFLTGGTINSPVDGTLRLRLNDDSNVDVTGFSLSTSGDSGSNTLYLGDTLGINGLTGITTTDNGDGSIDIVLDNTAVTQGGYGSADTVATFTVDQQGRLVAAGDSFIDIVASQVSDFATSAETAIFTDANFVDSTDVEFVVTAGASVSASLSATSVSAGSYGSSSAVGTFTVDSKGRLTAASDVTIDGSAIDNNTLTFTGTDASSASAALNGSITFTSLDNSVAISGNGSTIDVQVSDAAIKNIYTEDGTLTSARTVTQNNNSLSFTGGDFSVDGDTFNVNDTNNSVSIGAASANASAVLEVASTSKGFLFPRMTESDRTGINSPATGLMVYQTDGDEGIYIKKSFGWVQVI